MKVCLFSGYIRNRVQLCEELSLRPPFPQDVEHSILEAGFARWGCDIGNYICGSFVMAILDEESGELFCARDPLGLEPFYYCFDSDGAFLYGNNIDDVASGLKRREINREALHRYMMFGYPVGEATLYQGIRKLMPGHYLVYDGSELQIQPYFTLSFKPDFSRSEEQWTRDIERTLSCILAEDAETLAPAKPCSFLSSGVDSSCVLAMSGAKRAYGIGYSEDAFSEAKEASATARYLGAEFSEVTITSDQLFVAIPRLVRSAGLPLADASTVALLLGCEEIARNESFCMSGEGADELFAGYHIYRRADELGQTGGPWHYGCFGLMQNDDAQRLLMMEESYPTENLVKHLYDATESSERLSRLQVIDCALWLEGDILLGVHAASRASGLHLLFPYADRRMVDLATRIPARLRLKDGCGKYILRKTAQKRLPREVAFRSKIGFPTPVSAWMREQPQRESIESLLFSCCSSQFFDKRLVSSYWSSFLDGDDDMYHIVYAIYVFLIWYQECFSKDT